MSHPSNRRLPVLLLIITVGLIPGLLAGYFLSKSVSSTRQGKGPPLSSEGDEVITFERILAEADHSGLGNARVRRMLDFVESLESSELEPLLDRAQAKNESGRINSLIGMLYARWVELDLEAALHHAENQPGYAQQSSLGTVLQLWAAKNSQEAWQWFEKNGSRLSQGTVGESILREIVRDDPERALALYAGNADMRRSNWSSGPAFLYGLWALNDPAAAAARLEKVENPRHRRNALTKIASVWSGKDLDAAWHWADKLSRKNERLSTIKMMASTLAIQDLKRAEDLVANIPQGDTRKTVINAIIDGLAISDSEAAYAFATAKSTEIGTSSSFTQIFTRWAYRDAERAFAIARDELDPGPERDKILQNIIHTVAGYEIDLAIKMLEEFGLDSNPTLAVNRVAGEIAQNDIKRAIAWAKKLPAGKMKNLALTRVISEWLEKAPEEAAEYALGVAAKDPQKELLHNAISRWSHLDGAPAVKWAHKHLKTEDQLQLIPSAVSQWAKEDIQGASDWTGALPPGALRDACLTSLASRWGALDPAGSEEWLDKLEPGPTRVQAMRNYVYSLFNRDPDKALLWAGKIEDPAQRSLSVEQTAHRYLRAQPEKARQAILNSSLPDEEKKALLGEK